MITGAVIGFMIFCVLWLISGLIIAPLNGKKIIVSMNTFMAIVVLTGLGASIGYFLQ